MTFSAIILAGGRSRRMGCDKARLEVDGEALLSRQIRVARESGASEIYVSGRAGADYSAAGCEVLEDRFRDAGPLGGIERGLMASPSPLLLVLAVDMPNLGPGLVRRLAVSCSRSLGAIPFSHGGIEPLVAFYPREAHPLALAQLQNGLRSVRHFAALCVQSGIATLVPVGLGEVDWFANWNSPADLQDPANGRLEAPRPKGAAPVTGGAASARRGRP